MIGGLGHAWSYLETGLGRTGARLDDVRLEGDPLKFGEMQRGRC